MGWDKEASLKTYKTSTYSLRNGRKWWSLTEYCKGIMILAENGRCQNKVKIKEGQKTEIIPPHLDCIKWQQKIMFSCWNKRSQVCRSTIVQGNHFSVYTSIKQTHQKYCSVYIYFYILDSFILFLSVWVFCWHMCLFTTWVSAA